MMISSADSKPSKKLLRLMDVLGGALRKVIKEQPDEYNTGEVIQWRSAGRIMAQWQYNDPCLMAHPELLPDEITRAKTRLHSSLDQSELAYFENWLIDELLWVHALMSESVSGYKKMPVQLFIFSRMPNIRLQFISEKQLALISLLAACKNCTWNELIERDSRKKASLMRDLRALIWCGSLEVRPATAEELSSQRNLDGLLLWHEDPELQGKEWHSTLRLEIEATAESGRN
jgi:hypothetical protein